MYRCMRAVSLVNLGFEQVNARFVCGAAVVVCNASGRGRKESVPERGVRVRARDRTRERVLRDRVRVAETVEV